MKAILKNLLPHLKKLLPYSHKIIFVPFLCVFELLYAQIQQYDENKKYIIIQYNIENLFHPQNDSMSADDDFTPNGKYRWNLKKYYAKIDKISKVICNIGQWKTPLLVSLCEIENEQCLMDLCRKLKKFNYDYVHYDSEDPRGIDVALLYDKENFFILHTEKIAGTLPNFNNTRDILMVKGCTKDNDTLFIFVCHLPSKLGGAITNEKRNLMKQKIQHKIDSLVDINHFTNIIVLGDMNDKPIEDIKYLHNLTLNTNKKMKGTYKYKGKWEMLDQIYISPSLLKKAQFEIYFPDWLLEKDYKFLGDKPKRTFVGYKYNSDGYSDHLPIILYIKKPIDIKQK